MNQLLARLANLNLSAYILTPRWISWSSATRGTGETFAFSNTRPQTKATVFGQEGVNASVSILDTNNPQASSTTSNVTDGKLITVWLNDITREESVLYIETYGTECIAILKDDGSVDMLTQQQAEELLASDASDVSTEQHASVE